MTYLLLFVVIVLPMVIAVISPTWMIYLLALIGPLPIGGDASSAIGFLTGKIDINSLRVLGSTIGAAIIVLRYFGRSMKVLPVCICHILFLFLVCITLVWTSSVIFGLRTVAKLAAPLVLLIAVGVTINEEKKVQRLLSIISLSCMLSAVIAISTRMLGMSSDPKLTIPGVSAAVFSANMLVGLIVALNQESKKKILKTLFIGIYTALILASDTRITIAAMFVILSIYAYLRMEGILKVVIPVSSVSAFLMLVLLVDKFRDRMFLGSQAVSLDSAKGFGDAMSRLAGSGRFAAWDYVIDKFFKPQMVFGSGIGTTQHYFYSSKLGIGAIHSEYVRLLTETGLIGTTLFLFSMLWYYLRMRRNFGQPSSIKYIYSMGICSMFAYLTFMATDNAFDYVNQFGFYIFGMMGIAIAYPAVSSNTQP